MGVDVDLYIYDVVVKKFTFAISSPDEFLFTRNPAIAEGPRDAGVPVEIW